MKVNSKRGASSFWFVLVCIAPSLVYAHSLAPGLTWANGSSDGGDLITAAATSGIAHPTGYPTYLLLARLFQMLPVGDFAFRTNVLSAWAAVMCGAGVYMLTMILLTPHTACRWCVHVTATIATFVLSFSPLFWAQAVVAEVYSLNALFVVVLLLCILRDLLSRAATPHGGNSTPRPYKTGEHGGRSTPHHYKTGVHTPLFPLQGVIAGLALGNHLTVALPIAIWLFVSSRTRQTAPHTKQWQWRQVWQRVIWLGVGLLIYGILPLRAYANPPINWGYPITWDGFWWLITAQPYQAYAFGVPIAMLGGRVATFAKLLIEQVGMLGLIIGFIGMLYGNQFIRPQARLFLPITVFLACGYSLFAIAYNTADSTAYLIPVILIFAIWIGCGMIVLMNLVQHRQAKLVPFLALIVAIGLFWHIPTTYSNVDASNDNRAIQYARAVLTTAPHGAILVTSGDRDTFTLWYYHHALGQRDDVVILVEPLLAYQWYRQHVQQRYHDVLLPQHPDQNWRIEDIVPDHRPICDTLLDGDAVLRCGRK